MGKEINDMRCTPGQQLLFHMNQQLVVNHRSSIYDGCTELLSHMLHLVCIIWIENC